jgi:hypothetical protein
MSDSVTKWYEMQNEEQEKEVERVTSSSSPILSEGIKSEAYTILITYHEDAILEAARILKVDSSK